MLCFCATFFFPSSCTHDCTNLQISWNGSSTSKIKNANRPCCVCIEPAVNQNLSSTQDRNTRHHLLQRLQLLLHSFKVHKSREKMKFFQYFTLCYNYRVHPTPPTSQRKWNIKRERNKHHSSIIVFFEISQPKAPFCYSLFEMQKATRLPPIWKPRQPRFF